MKKKNYLYKVIYVILLIIAIIILFRWYATQNRSRMEERNKNYAADSARQIANKIDDELSNALKEVNENMLFDVLVYTDADGINHSSDGKTSDASGRDYYLLGMQGNSGISVVFDSKLYSETMLCFYAPVVYNGEIIGVLRGAYLAEEYLKDMLATTYFGESASVHLCMPDGQILACSDSKMHEGSLIDVLVQMGMIDETTAKQAGAVFENGGEGAFICKPGSRTDNICVRYLSNHNFVLVQTFPKSVTETMIRDENLVGLRLETGLIVLFILYIVAMLLSAGREKRYLEHENREMGYIISGVNTLFTRFTMVDFDTDTYCYLAGTKPEDEAISVKGSYRELSEHLCEMLIEESDREAFAEFLDKHTIIEAMKKHNDLLFECHIMHDGKPQWKHFNVICLERKNGLASKVLFTRQNITEAKERELLIQTEMALANRKERQ